MKRQHPAGPATIDMGSWRDRFRIVVLGLCFAVVGQAIYGPLLISKTISDSLRLDLLGLHLHVGTDYVGVVLALGQMLGLTMLQRWQAASRVKVGTACCVGVALATAVIAAFPHGLVLGIATLVASVFTVAIFPVWERVEEAAPEKATPLLMTFYAVGLAVLGFGFDAGERKLGISGLFAGFAGLLLLSAILIWWLTPSEPDDRVVSHGRLRDELRDPGRRRVILIALLSGMALHLHDTEVVPLYDSLGLTRGDAAYTGWAFLIAALIAWRIMAKLQAWKSAVLLLAAALLPISFLLAGWPGLLAPTGLTLVNVLLVQRSGLELGTTLITSLTPGLYPGMAFMIAVQAGRFTGMSTGAVVSSVGFDLGGRLVLVSAGVAAGVGCVALCVPLLWAERRRVAAALRPAQTGVRLAAAQNLVNGAAATASVPALALIMFDGGHRSMLWMAALAGMALIVVTVTWSGIGDVFSESHVVRVAWLGLAGALAFAVGQPLAVGPGRLSAVAACGLLVAVVTAMFHPSPARTTRIADPDARSVKTWFTALHACRATGVVVGAGVSAWAASVGGIALVTVPVLSFAVVNVIVTAAWTRRLPGPVELVMDPPDPIKHLRDAMPPGTALIAWCLEEGGAIAIVDAREHQMRSIVGALGGAQELPFRVVHAVAWDLPTTAVGVALGHTGHREAEIRDAVRQRDDQLGVANVHLHRTPTSHAAILELTSSRCLVSPLGRSIMRAVGTRVPGLEAVVLVRHLDPVLR